MLKYLILSLLILSELGLYAQKKLSYEGPYQNGIPAKATARYSYFVDKSGKKIKDGSFRYLVKEKEHDYRFMQNFQGNYSHGLKDGAWEYEIKSKDYTRDNEGFYTTSEISLKASYSVGYPDGEWIYSALVYKRKKKADGDWDKKILVKDVKMQVNFKDGVLMDSIQIHDNQGITLDVLCDAEGFLDGDFVIKSSKFSMKNQYADGFLKVDNGKKSLKYSYYQDNKIIREKDFTLDTITYFDEKNCLITKYLNDNIFNQKYFLFNYIKGDKIFKRNSRGFVTGISYKGLYVKQLMVSLTDLEKKIIADIWYYYSKVVAMEKTAKAALRKDVKNKALKNRVGALHQSAVEIKAYICITDQCKKEVVLSALLKASKSCGEMEILNKNFSSKKVLLQELLKASRAAYLKADKLSKQ